MSSVIPGARSVAQARANAAAGSAVLPASLTAAVPALYDKYFRAAVHGRW